MNYKLKINITQDILEKSKNCGGNASNCAISTAIRDIFPNAKTYPSGIKQNGNYEECGIHLPNEAIDFICKFDFKSPEERVKMKPISFEIEVPDVIIDKIGISQVEEILKESTTMELV